MDWHWVDVKKQFPDAGYNKTRPLFWSDGWTGYSWNTELFPDYRGFLKFLHEQGLKVTLNLHPALGIRSFENCYDAAARAMGLDPAEKSR